MDAGTQYAISQLENRLGRLERQHEADLRQARAELVEIRKILVRLVDESSERSARMGSMMAAVEEMHEMVKHSGCGRPVKTYKGEVPLK